MPHTRAWMLKALPANVNRLGAAAATRWCGAVDVAFRTGAGVAVADGGAVGWPERVDERAAAGSW